MRGDWGIQVDRLEREIMVSARGWGSWGMMWEQGMGGRSEKSRGRQ